MMNPVILNGASEKSALVFPAEMSQLANPTLYKVVVL